MGWDTLTPAQRQFVQRYLKVGPQDAVAEEASSAPPPNEAQPGTAVPKDNAPQPNRRLPELQALEAGIDGLLAEFGPDGA